MRRQDFTLSAMRSPSKNPRPNVFAKQLITWDHNMKTAFTRTNSPPLQLLHRTKAVRQARQEQELAERVGNLHKTEKPVLSIQRVDPLKATLIALEAETDRPTSSQVNRVAYLSPARNLNQSHSRQASAIPAIDSVAKRSTQKDFRLRQDKKLEGSANTQATFAKPTVASSRVKKKASKSLLTKAAPKTEGELGLALIPKLRNKRKNSIKVSAKFFSDAQMYAPVTQRDHQGEEEAAAQHKTHLDSQRESAHF